MTTIKVRQLGNGYVSVDAELIGFPRSSTFAKIPVAPAHP
jgi:hypothetical protein